MSNRLKLILAGSVLLAVAIYAVAQNIGKTGEPVSTYAALVAGSDGTNTRALSVDSTGKLQTGVTTIPSVDPCQSPSIAKTSVVINITTATTTSLVAISGTTVIYVCGFAVTVGSTVTSDTILFEYGTGATCGTGTTALTGAFNTAGLLTGSIVYGGAGETVFKTAAANGLCAVSTVGTGPSIQGVLTFVQQ